VKTQSSFWTSDDDAYGRRNLLGGFVFRYIVRLVSMVGVLFVDASSGDDVYVVCGMCQGGCLLQASTSALLLVTVGLLLLLFRLLATFLGAWCCLAISSAVRDNVDG
jgi:hypothetical protein